MRGPLFERGIVDAWVIWEPFLAAAETQLGVRILADGTGLVSNHQFFLAARPYAEKRTDVIAIILEEMARVDEWATSRPKEVATLLSPQVGLDPATLELAVRRESYGAKPVSDTVLADQQKIADVFYDLKLIPARINVRDAAFKLPETAAHAKH